MKKIYVVLALCVAGLSGCGEDDNNVSITPSLGFETASGLVLESSTTPVRVEFYSNVPVTEPVTVKVRVNNIDGLVYGEDYTTDPEPVNNEITVQLDPEDPSFRVIPAPGAGDVRNINFQIIEVSGNNLTLGQSTTRSYTLSIVKTLPGTTRTIAQVRSLFSGTTVNISDNIYLEGVIISSNDNVTAKSVYIQDATAAIVLRLAEDNSNTFKRGDKVRVSLAGTTLSAFNGLLQVNMAKAKGTVIGTAPLPTPRVITIDELNAKTYESQLVTISGVTFPAANGTLPVTGNTTFSKDGKTAIMRVESYSPFASKILPSGTVSVTGVASVFNTGQLIPQIATDIP